MCFKRIRIYYMKYIDTDPSIETNKEKEYCIIVEIFHGISEGNIGCIWSESGKGNNVSDDTLIHILMKYFKDVLMKIVDVLIEKLFETIIDKLLDVLMAEIFDRFKYKKELFKDTLRWTYGIVVI